MIDGAGAREQLCETVLKMRSLVLGSAAVEAGTGLAVVVAPRFGVRLLLGADVTGAGVATARVCGLALLCLAIACWPERDAAHPRATPGAVHALLVYNTLATAYFVYLRAFTANHGILLLPAIVFHGVMAALFLLQRSSAPAHQPG